MRRARSAARRKGVPAVAPLRRASCALVSRGTLFSAAAPIAGEHAFVVRWTRQGSGGQFGGAIPVGRDRWITYADYPSMARAYMLTGRVAMTFTIDERGRIEGCRIVRTNVGEILAGAMCPLLTRRALFLPALDADGRPRRAAGRFTTDWRWCEPGTRCRSPDVPLP